MGRMCRETKLKKSEQFASVDLFNETHLIYAGMDVVLAYGLFNVLQPKVPKFACVVIPREHSISEVRQETEHSGFWSTNDRPSNGTTRSPKKNASRAYARANLWNRIGQRQRASGSRPGD